MKKLLFLGSPFEYNKGGAEYQYKILEDYLKESYDIFYLFRYPTPLHEKKYITYDYILRKNYKEHLYTDSLLIYRLIKKLSPEIIYVKGMSYMAALGAHYAKSQNTRMVLHISSQRNVDNPKSEPGFKNFILNFLDRNIAKYVIRNVDQIICQANYQNILLQSNYGRCCNLVLPNFHPVPDNSLKKEPPLKIVWIANFKQLKQPEKFVALAENFKNQHSTKFIMIGRPASGVWQKKLFQDMNRLSNLEYMGELPIDKVNEVLSESHILVNTSQYEGFPNTYIQAWMRKVPVVTLNCDPDDLIKKKGIGYHSRTFPNMVQDVNKLIENKQMRERMGEKSQEFAFSTFSVSNIQKLINLIEET